MQKTAYEMRISDWCSDLCSSDLIADERDRGAGGAAGQTACESAGEPAGGAAEQIAARAGLERDELAARSDPDGQQAAVLLSGRQDARTDQRRRAGCAERGRLADRRGDQLAGRGGQAVDQILLAIARLDECKI